MVLKEQYYQLVERDTEYVSSKWKVIHLVALAVAAASGCITAFNMGRIEDHFGSNCVLNAKIVFATETKLESIPAPPPLPTATPSVENNSTTETDADDAENVTQQVETFKSGINVTPIDLSATNWGYGAYCDFCQFTSVASMISAIVWWAFFVLVTKGGKGYMSDIFPQPWKIVYPFLVFAIIMTACLTISTVYLMDGIYNFCNEFTPIFNNTLCVVQMNIYTLQFHDKERPFYLNYALIKIFSYAGLSAWIIQILTVLWRILVAADFQVYLITLQEKKEHVQRVTEYSDQADKDSITEVTEV